MVRVTPPPGARRRVTPLVLAGALVLLFGAGTARADAAADSARVRAWQTGTLGPDRLQHASLSFAIGLGAGLATDSPAAGAGIALGLGLAKELLDRRGPGFDRGDLLADALGAALAALATAALNR